MSNGTPEAEEAFRLIRAAALDGIRKTADRCNILCTWKMLAGHPNSMFLNFHFGHGQNAKEHAQVLQGVLDIAELLTSATRNPWRFSPQLIAEPIPDCKRAEVFYQVPVPIEHKKTVRHFAQRVL